MGWSFEYLKLGDFTYHVLRDPLAIKAYLMKWILREWEADHNEAPDEEWTVEWMNILPKMEFALEMLGLDSISIPRYGRSEFFWPVLRLMMVIFPSARATASSLPLELIFKSLTGASYSNLFWISPFFASRIWTRPDSSPVTMNSPLGLNTASFMESGAGSTKELFSIFDIPHAGGAIRAGCQECDAIRAEFQRIDGFRLRSLRDGEGEQADILSKDFLGFVRRRFLP